MNKFFVFAVIGVLCLAACHSTARTEDYPVAVLDKPPGESRERLFDKKESAGTEADATELDIIETPDRAETHEAEPETAELPESGELAETGFPETPPEEEEYIPQPPPSPPEPAPAVAETERENTPDPAPPPEPLPEISREPEPEPKAPPIPPPPPAAARPAPVTPPVRPAPPPVPGFIRPSEPFVPPDEIAEVPQTLIPDMPARQYPPREAEIQYSRTVSAFKGQYIEIPFRGPGWVYLGELGSRRGVYYDSRRIDNEGMTFVFRAGEEGTYSLKFDKHDFIHDTTLNDHVMVLVTLPPEITGSAWNAVTSAPERVYASPRWPPAIPVSAPASAPAAVLPEQPAVQQEARQAETANSQALPDTSLPGAYMNRAWEEYNAGRVSGALGILDQFSAAYPAGSDEAYWLYGQTLEANSPRRDIALALDYYRRLTREYPQSARYDAARRRIAYLERFYFSIQ